MLIVAPFTMAKITKQLEFWSTDKWVKKISNIPLYGYTITKGLIYWHMLQLGWILETVSTVKETKNIYFVQFYHIKCPKSVEKSIEVKINEWLP